MIELSYFFCIPIRFVKTNNGLIYEGHKVAVEEVGRVHIGHLVQLGKL